ncbi:MAG TPA: single-stranded-DNA-specific exonuclease RecJ [Cytophagaceae bacterium]|jgi:single-stranded-DNA-specific exonuclease
MEQQVLKTGKNWRLKAIPESTEVAGLSAAINVNETLAQLLIQRGINNFETAKDFFRPSMQHLHDPYLMKDMDKAVDRLERAIRSEEKILIYGDYDVDGTTSVSLVYGYLSKITDKLEVYIPDRYKEGYGVSKQSIEYAAENGFGLIITLDCGIKSIEHVATANKLGIDFVICDHHKPGDELPNAIAVLDPKRRDCGYPYKELSGCGVGFKLMEAFAIKHRLDKEDLYQFLDLVAISIASDIVPITGENRVLTCYGLKKINQSPRPGVKALREIAGYKREMDVTDVVFGLGPRINAAGRIAHAKGAVDLLLSRTDEEARHFAIKINEKNSIRKDVDSSITEEALKMIEAGGLLKDSKSTVLFKNDWHKGVIGIVASRCIEKFYKPTIILTESNNMAAGSARSVHGFDVYEAIAQCSDLLEQFGGHMYAAGLTMKVENVEAFQKRFEEVVCSLITPEQLCPNLEIDLKINLDEVNYKLYNILKQMGPFGPGNMHPMFMSEEVYDNGKAKIVKEQHLKMCLRQGDSDSIEAIGFGMSEYYPRIAAREKFRVCYTICENEFNGQKSLQLMVKDIKFANES